MTQAMKSVGEGGRHTPFEHVEIELLLEGIYQRYGFDFRDYARASICRRIWKRVREEELTTVSGLQEKVLHDIDCMERLLLDLSVQVTAMFRDPGFYRSLRRNVVPVLRTYPTIRIWNAGCSTGEEAYSVALLMAEEGLYDRCRIYATDANEAVLQRAKSGVLPLTAMRRNTVNHQQAGGTSSLSEHYIAKHGGALLNPDLAKNIVFAQHNLVTDGSINEFNLILCRNVMIYFNAKLQARVYDLLYESLCMLGFLGIGRRESLHSTPKEHCYEPLDASERIYRKQA